jgi:hypothetical protein
MNTSTARTFTVLLLAWCTVAISFTRAQAQCVPHQWQPMGAVPGVYGTVNAMVEWDPDGDGPLPSVLVVGGTIQAAGAHLVNNIAMWDGQAWGTLGTGLPSSEDLGGVGALLVHDGQLIASGDRLIDAAGLPLGPIVRWDGAGWVTFAPFSGGAGAMVEFNGGIAAAITTTDGTSYFPQVALWNGVQWQTLGLVAGGANNESYVSAFALDNGRLIAAGQFTSIAGVASNGLARWNGAVWEDMNLPPGSVCQSVACNGTDTAVGTSVTSGSSTVYHLLKLQAGSWVDLPIPFFDFGYGAAGHLTTVGQDIYATDSGPFFVMYGGPGAGVARLDGSQWTQLGTFMSTVYTVASFRAGLVAGGFMDTASGRGVRGIASWDGLAWQALGTGLSNPGAIASIKVDNGQIYACGVRTSDQTGGAIMRWNGLEWERVLSADSLRVEVYQNDLILSSVDNTLGLRRFNGSTLDPIGPTRQGGCVPYVVGGRLYSITNQWTHPASVYRLDPAGWIQLGQSFDSTITSLDSVDGDLYMLGANDSESGIRMVARWDGASWIAVGTYPDLVTPMGISSAFRYNGQLIASGGFWPYENAFAVLNNGQWDIWPSPYRGAIARIVGTEIVAVAETSDCEESLVVAFDGVSWRTLGTVELPGGIDGVSDIQLCGDGVVIAGTFVSINGQCSHMFARLPSIHCCGSADFDADGAPGTDADVQAFFACISGLCCPTCGSPDFNGDGGVATDADIEAFFRVLAGGNC